MVAFNQDYIGSLQRSLGRRIRELRRKHGWTQEQFAQTCGLHRTYMGHVERGEKNVSLSTVARVADALGVRIAVLFGKPRGGEGTERAMGRPSAADARPAPLHQMEVGRLLDELEEQRKAMRRALRDISGLLARFGGAVS